jgi:hypothetical protein
MGTEEPIERPEARGAYARAVLGVVVRRTVVASTVTMSATTAHTISAATEEAALPPTMGARNAVSAGAVGRMPAAETR